MSISSIPSSEPCPPAPTLEPIKELSQPCPALSLPPPSSLSSMEDDNNPVEISPSSRQTIIGILTRW